MTAFTITTLPLENLIGAGRTADVYAWGKDEVLKLYQSWMPSSVVEREYTSTLAASQAGISVPEAHQLVQYQDRFGIIFERVRGVSLMRELELHPWRVRSIARQLAELHVQINHCQVTANLPSHREQIRAGILRSAALDPRKREHILQLLAALPEGNALCHGDFHPDNVLLTSNGPVIIDWFTGAHGMPAADLMRTLMILGTSALPPSVPALQRSLIGLLRSILVSTYRTHYLHLNPIPPAARNVWQLPLMAERLNEVEHYPQEKAFLMKQIDSLLLVPRQT